MFWLRGKPGDLCHVLRYLTTLVHSLIIHDGYPWEEKNISQEAACFDWEHPRCQKADVNLSIETKFTQRGTWAQTSPSPSKSLIYWKGRWKLELGDKEDSFHNALQSARIFLSTESCRLASCKKEWQIYASLWSWHSTRWHNPLRCGYGNHHSGHF